MMKPIKYFIAFLALSTLVFFRGIPMLCAAAPSRSQGGIVFYIDFLHSKYIYSVSMEGLTIQEKKGQKLHLHAEKTESYKFVYEIKNQNFSLNDLIAHTKGKGTENSKFKVEKSEDPYYKNDVERYFICKVDTTPLQSGYDDDGSERSKTDIRINLKNYFVVRVKDKNGREIGLLLVPIWEILNKTLVRVKEFKKAKEAKKAEEARKKGGIYYSSFSDEEEEYDGEGIDLAVVEKDGTFSRGNMIFIGTASFKRNFDEVKLGGRGNFDSVTSFVLNVTPVEINIFQKIKKVSTDFFISSDLLNIYQQARGELFGGVRIRSSWAENLEKFRELTLEKVEKFRALMVQLEYVSELSEDHILSKHYIAAVKENLGIKNLKDLTHILSRFFQDPHALPKDTGLRQKEKEKGQKSGTTPSDLLGDAPPQEEQTQKSKGTQTKTLNKPDLTDQKSAFQRGTSWYFFGGGAAIGTVLSLLGCWWVSSKSEDSSPQKEVLTPTDES